MKDDSTKTKSQRLMEEFLFADIEMGFTLLMTAKIEATKDARHSKAALEKARAALNTVRSLGARVEDTGAQAEIESRADELEAAIQKVAG